MAGSDWRRLHSASVAVNLIPTAWRALRSLWPLLVALFIGGAGRETVWLDLLLISVFFGTPIWRTVMHWLTLRYRVDEGRLEITSGLLYRQVRVIAPERIQNVELVRNVFHRMSGLVEVRVETASGGDIEGVLSALSEADATDLMTELDEARRLVRPDPTEESAAPLIQNSPLDLIRYGLSAARFGLVFVALGIGYEVAIQTSADRVQDTARVLGLAGTGILLMGLVLGTWLFGTLTVVVRHWGYRLSRTSESIVSEEGLFTRRRVELPIAKVQLVSITESWIRRRLGFGVLHIETAAAREGGGTQRAEAVIPVVPTERRSELLQHALPEAPRLEALPLTPPHPLAVRRALIGSLIRATLAALVLSYGLYPMGVIAWILVPLSGLAVWLDHRYQGWWIGPGHIVSRTGWFLRTTRIVARDKLQSLELVQGPIARRWGIGQLKLRVAGSAVRLPMQAFDAALDLEFRLVEQLDSTVAPTPGRLERRLPLFEEDHPSPEQQNPRDELGHEAHQGQTVEQQPLASSRPAREGHTPDEGDDPDRETQDTREEEKGGDRAGRPVEPVFPGHIGTDLQREDDAFDDHQPPERDVHGSDDGPNH